MKTKIILVLALAFISFASVAQKAGIKGGLNLSNLYIDDVDDENLKAGFNLGLYYRADVGSNFSVQPEILFTQKGSEVQYNSVLFGNNGRYRFNLNYLEVPILLVGRINNFHLEAGPYVGLLVAAKVKHVNNNGEIASASALDRDSFNTLDTGVAGGVGFDFDRGLLGVRYSYGFSEIGNDQAATDATPDSKNSALQIYLGFDF